MVPIEVVATTCPDALVERTAFGVPRKRLVVEAVAKKPSPDAVKTEVEALPSVVCPVTLSVPPKIPLPVVVKFPTTVEEACERKPEEKFPRPVMVELPVEMKAPLNICSCAQELAEASKDALLVRHVPPTEKQPAVRLRPLPKVEVPVVTFSAVVWIPAPKVEVAEAAEVMTPALLMLKRVVVELPLEDAMVKRLLPG